jgi:hypothetical protein
LAAPLLLAAGAVLLMCASLLPGLWRVVVLPALLLAPGYSLLRVLGQPTDRHSISIAIPVSIVLAIFASLVLHVSHIRLAPAPLGLLLGAATALFLGASYWRHLVTGLPGRRRTARLSDPTPVRSEATVGE